MEINILALSERDPQIPIELSTWIAEEFFFTDRDRTEKVKKLKLSLGEQSIISIFPADPDRIRELGEKLIKIADDLSNPTLNTDARGTAFCKKTQKAVLPCAG